MKNNRLAAVVLLAAVASIAAGCSKNSGHPATYPVHGVVTYQGKPVEGAGLTFIAPGAPRYAMGKTDAAGKFSLTTFEPDDGAVAGTHAVVVVKMPPRTAAAEPAASPDAPVKPADIDAAMTKQAEQVVKSAKSKSLLPEKYADESTTDLHFDVVDGENVFEIKLTD
jgi:altronate dehydratase